MKYLTIVAFLLITIAPAYAYIDAGSGSYILQMIIAGGLAFAYTLKLTWKRLSDSAGKLFGAKKLPLAHTEE